MALLLLGVALAVQLTQAQLVTRSAIVDNQPIYGSLPESNTITYSYFACDGNAPFRVRLEVEYGEPSLYLWRTVEDDAKPAGWTTPSGASWFDMAFMSSSYDSSAEEVLLVAENLAVKDWVIGVRNTGVYAAQFKLTVEPVPRDLGDRGLGYALTLNQGCSAQFNLSGIAQPNLHSVVTAQSSSTWGKYNLGMVTPLGLDASVVPTLSYSTGSRPADALGQNHSFLFAPQFEIGPNRLDLECTSCQDPVTLSAKATELFQPTECRVAGFYGAGSLAGLTCNRSSDCQHVSSDKLRCVWPSLISCYEKLVLSGTWSAKSLQTSCGPLSIGAPLNSATAWCSENNLPGEWLQLDLGQPMVVTGVQTQGQADQDNFVKSYKLFICNQTQCSSESEFWAVQDGSADKVFAGNTGGDRSTVVSHTFARPLVNVRAVRWEPFSEDSHVSSYSGHMSMRVAVRGCTVSDAGLCQWNAPISGWTSIPGWRGGCGQFSDCRNATWKSTCQGVQQCNAGPQYGMGPLPATNCSRNTDCQQLPPSRFRCRDTRCQYAADGTSFQDIAWWSGSACSVDADCYSARVNNSRRCGGPPLVMSPFRISPVVSTSVQPLDLLAGERRILQSLSCYNSTGLELDLRGVASYAQVFVSSKLQLDSLLNRVKLCNGPTCVCRTSSNAEIPGATCGSDSDCHAIAASSLRCSMNSCEYQSSELNWVEIAGTQCSTQSDCANQTSEFFCGGMQSCKLAQVWGGAELVGSRCKLDSDCIGLSSSQFSCNGEGWCEFRPETNSSGGVISGLGCSSDLDCSAARVKAGLECTRGWDGSQVSVRLNNSCSFTPKLVLNSTLIRVNSHPTDMRGSSCTSTADCQAISNKYLRCAGFAKCPDGGSCTVFSEKYAEHILSPGRCEYQEWTPTGKSIWHQIPDLVYPDQSGCDSDYLCHALRAQLSCNGTVGACMVADSYGGGSLFLSECQASSDCRQIPASNFLCNNDTSRCEFAAAGGDVGLPIPYWSTTCTSNNDCQAQPIRDTSWCAVGHRCKLAQQFGGFYLPGTACNRSSDCLAIPPSLFSCNTSSGACLYNGTLDKEIVGWKGLTCATDADCQSANVLHTLECEALVRLPAVASVTSYVDLWPQQVWSPAFSQFADVYIDQATGSRVQDPTLPATGSNLVFADPPGDPRIEFSNVWSSTAAAEYRAQIHTASRLSSTQGRQSVVAPMCQASPSFLVRQGGTRVGMSVETPEYMYRDNRLFDNHARQVRTAKTRRCRWAAPNSIPECSFTQTTGRLTGTQCSKDAHCRPPVLQASSVRCLNTSECALGLDFVNFVGIPSSPTCHSDDDCVTVLTAAVCVNSTYCAAKGDAGTWTAMAGTTGACTGNIHCQQLGTSNFSCHGLVFSWDTFLDKLVIQTGECAYAGQRLSGIPCTTQDDCVDNHARTRYSCWPSSLEGELLNGDSGRDSGGSDHGSENTLICNAPEFNWDQVPTRDGTLPAGVLPMVEVEENILVLDQRRNAAGGPFMRHVPFDPPRVSRTLASMSVVGSTMYQPNEKLNWTWPPIGPMKGGNLLRVSGQDFIDTHEILVRFNQGESEDVRADFISSSQVQLQAPRFKRSGFYSLSISLNAQHFRQHLDPIYYRAVPDPIILGLAPAAGPVLGGTAVVVTGEHFSFMDLGLGTNPQPIRSNIRCRFGTDPLLVVVATAASGTEVSCTSPRAHETGMVTLYVSIDEQQWIGSHNTFLYYPQVATIAGTCTSGTMQIGNESLGSSILGGSSCNTSAECRNTWPKQDDLFKRYGCRTVTGVGDRCQFDAYDGPYNVNPIPKAFNPIPSLLNYTCTDSGAEWSLECANLVGASSPRCAGRPGCVVANGGALLAGSDCTNDGDCDLIPKTSFRCNQANCQYRQLIGVNATMSQPPQGISPPGWRHIQGWSYNCSNDEDCYTAARPRCGSLATCVVAGRLGTGRLEGLECSPGSSPDSCVEALALEIRTSPIHPLSCDLLTKVCKYRQTSIEGWKALSCQKDADCRTDAITTSLQCSPVTHLWAVQPEFIPTNRSVTITVDGDHLQNTSSLSCRFATVELGTWLVKASFISSGRISCNSPIISSQFQPHLIAAGFEVTQDLQGFTTSGIQLNFYSPPHVLSLFPDSGPTSGGTNITITGTGFVDSNQGRAGSWLACTWFGLGQHLARFIDSTRVVCTSPASPQILEHQNSTFSISFSGGQQGVSLRFQYFPDTVKVLGSLPDSSTGAGGARVRVRGHNFVDTGSIRVQLGPWQVDAEFVSAEEVSFVVPTHYVTQCHVKKFCYLEQVNTKDTPESSALTNYPACSVSNRATHSPYANYTDGIQPLNIRWCSDSSGGIANRPPTIGCDTVLCRRANCTAELSRWDSFLETEFNLRADGTIPYYGDATTICAKLPTLGGTADDMKQLTPWAELEIPWPADLIGAEQSPSEARLARLCLQLNGQDCIANYTSFTYYLTPTVTQVTPRSGPQVGASTVLVQGLNFAHFPQQTGTRLDLNPGTSLVGKPALTPLDPMVRFVTQSNGNTLIRSAKAWWVSEAGGEQGLKCILPASPLSRARDPPTAKVEVSFNQYNWLVLGDYQFKYLNWPTKVLSLDPPMGPIDGGTEVLISGFNWSDTGEIECRFGFLRQGLDWQPNLVAGSFVPAAADCGDDCNPKVRCASPAAIRSFDWKLGTFIDATSRTVQLEVSLNSQQFSDSSVNFYYTPTDSLERNGVGVHTIWPSSGPRSTGGTLVTLVGQHFGDPTTYTKCRFMFGNGHDPNITSIVVAATVLNQSAISCATPAIPSQTWLAAGTVVCPDNRAVSITSTLPSDCYGLLPSQVSIALDGQIFTSSNATFEFAGTSVLINIAPKSAATNLASNITITGRHFVNSSSLACRFGTVSFGAEATSATEIVVEIPPYPDLTPGEGVQVSCALDGMVWDDSNSIDTFTVTQALPVDTPLSPSSGDVDQSFSAVLKADGVLRSHRYYLYFGTSTPPINPPSRCSGQKDPTGLALLEIANSTCHNARLKAEHVCTSEDPGLVVADLQVDCSYWCDTSDNAFAYQNAKEAVPLSIVCGMGPSMFEGQTESEEVAVQMSSNGQDWVTLTYPFTLEKINNPCGSSCTSGTSMSRPNLGWLLLMVVFGLCLGRFLPL